MRISDWSSDVCSSDLPSPVIADVRNWPRALASMIASNWPWAASKRTYTALAPRLVLIQFLYPQYPKTGNADPSECMDEPSPNPPRALDTLKPSPRPSERKPDSSASIASSSATCADTSCSLSQIASCVIICSQSSRIVDYRIAKHAHAGHFDFKYITGFKQQRRFARHPDRSEEHTSELQSLMRISYAVFC